MQSKKKNIALYQALAEKHNLDCTSAFPSSCVRKSRSIQCSLMQAVADLCQSFSAIPFLGGDMFQAFADAHNQRGQHGTIVQGRRIHNFR
jgi:hypothetical protein